MKAPETVGIALVGQPNCGKSTVFNALTGAHQHVANWPGVTVDKISGWYRHEGQRVEVVDLPGAYSLISFSPEERVTRNFLLQQSPQLIVNVIDASKLRQGLTLTLQLLEMGLPLLINLNMMDVAEQQGLQLDVKKLEQFLQTPVVATSMKNRRDARRLKQTIAENLLQRTPTADSSVQRIVDYQELELVLHNLEQQILQQDQTTFCCSPRWAAIKLLSGDPHCITSPSLHTDCLQTPTRKARNDFMDQTGETIASYCAGVRNVRASQLAEACQTRTERKIVQLSERIDRVVCHRLAGPFILLGVMFLLYYCSIVLGYKVTEYTWPLLAKLRLLVEKAAPVPGFIEIPLVRAYMLWFIDSVNALLNYLPIFFILFTLIAVLEDSGYMPRMAFITDRILRRFGLHGQSVLPMVLGGVYVGGCAVPAVMSCKGIPDERSRLATILITPLLNCQAKAPLYILLINAYFSQNKGFGMFFISSVGLLLLLPVAKLLTMTLLKDKETAPFLLEMPAYHLPTVRTVLAKAVERIWLYLKKITTVVVAVASIIFILLQFPGVKPERRAAYEQQQQQMLAAFQRSAGFGFAEQATAETVMPLLLHWDAYRKAKAAAKGDTALQAIERLFQQQNPAFYPYLQPGDDSAAAKINRALRKLAREREALLVDIRKERLENSLLGRLGRNLEPLSQWAGFDWRVNVALLSSLAAKESSVATLGALYDQTDSQDSLEDRMVNQHTGFTPLHALAVMLFMVLYPPCIATTVAVKVQTGSVRWMLFSMFYPITMGLAVAVPVFSGSQLLGLDGVQAMYLVWWMALLLAVLSGGIRSPGKKQAAAEDNELTTLGTACKEN